MRLLLLVSLCATTALGQVVPWRVRTPSVPSTQAADPALVSGGSGEPLLVGTDSAQVGLMLYGLDGGFHASLLVGATRSADALDDVVVAAAYVLQELKVYRHLGGSLADALEAPFSVPTPTAVALAREPDGGLIAWVDDSSQSVRKVALTPVDGGLFAASAAGSVSLATSTAGLAVDPRTGTVYAAVAARGVVAIESDVPRYVVSIDAGDLGPVVGGLDVYPLASGGVLLFTASPASAEVVVHQVSASGLATYRGRFAVGASADGGGGRVQLPQHLDVHAGALPGFPQGALVVHDGVLANYSLVGLEDVSAAFSPPLPLPLGGAGGGAGGGGGGGSDAGTGGGGGSSGLPGPDGGTGNPKPPPGSEPTPTGCGCTAVPLVALPALLLLWWIRRPRS